MTYSNFQQILDGLEVTMCPEHRARVEENLEWGTMDVAKWNDPFNPNIIHFPIEEVLSD